MVVLGVEIYVAQYPLPIFFRIILDFFENREKFK